MYPHITLATKTLHRVDEPRHYMRVKPVPQKVTITKAGQVLANSHSAVRLTEVGRDVYDPVIYVPRADVKIPLVQTDRSTHCPLKGDATYFSVDLDDGENLIWAYDAPIPPADGLKGFVAFYPDRVTVTEGES
ncbi:MAG: DUF427 domain-containing protein [Pseudomonadota bacterium]